MYFGCLQFNPKSKQNYWTQKHLHFRHHTCAWWPLNVNTATTQAYTTSTLKCSFWISMDSPNVICISLSSRPWFSLRLLKIDLLLAENWSYSTTHTQRERTRIKCRARGCRRPHAFTIFIVAININSHGRRVKEIAEKLPSTLVHCMVEVPTTTTYNSHRHRREEWVSRLIRFPLSLNTYNTHNTSWSMFIVVGVFRLFSH